MDGLYLVRTEGSLEQSIWSRRWWRRQIQIWSKFHNRL